VAFAFAVVPVHAQLLHYQLNEPSGTNSPNTGTIANANGTLNGTSTWVAESPGVFANAFDTNGGAAGNYITVPDSDLTGLDNLSTITVTGWINLQAPYEENDRLFAKTGNFDIRITQDHLRLTINTTQLTASDDIDSIFTTGAGWLFWAATYDADDTNKPVSYYYGSTTTAVTSLGGGNNPTGPANTGTSTNPLWIANGPTNNTLDRTPDAWFSDVRFYDAALSSSALDTVRLQAIPEPSTVTLALVGLGSMALLRRRRR